MIRVLLLSLVLASCDTAAQERTSDQGPTLPSTCTVGDRWFKTTDPVGTHECRVTNVWTPPSTASSGGGGPVAWQDITDKPAVFPPVIGSGAADAVAGNDSRLTDARTPTAHAHAQSEVTNLVTALAGKAAASHAHAIADTTGLQTALDGKAASGHSHAGVYEPANANIQAHVTAAHAPANAQANADITKAEIEAKLTGVISSHSHAGGGSGPSYVVLGSDVTNATTAYANITGLSFAAAAATRYDVECRFQYNANATTTGIGIGWTGPASPTLTSGFMLSGITTATAGATTIVGNDAGAVTTASVATTGNYAEFRGMWINGATAGTVQMRFKSEVAVANAIVLKAGSFCKVNTF